MATTLPSDSALAAMSLPQRIRLRRTVRSQPLPVRPGLATAVPALLFLLGVLLLRLGAAEVGAGGAVPPAAVTAELSGD